MKFLLFISFLIPSLSFAIEDYSWDRTSFTSEHAKNPKEVKALQKKYPQYLPNIKKIYSATIFFSEWTYIGETVCEASDPRLVWKNVYVSACHTVNGGVECPLDMAPRPDDQQDPCLKN